MSFYYGLQEHRYNKYTGPIFYVDNDMNFISGSWCEDDIDTRELTVADYEKYKQACNRYELVYSECCNGYEARQERRT